MSHAGPIMQLSGARVLITGASSGIGRAAAVKFADAGCHLVLTGRDSARLGEIADVTGGGDIVTADLSDPADVSRLVQATTAAGTPDLVVQCAGIGHFARAMEQDSGDLERLFRINLLAPIELTKAFLPAMMRNGAGRLVFVTSIAGELGVAGESGYAASKAALGVFAASLGSELTGSGVGVTTVVPGAVDTDFFDHRGAGYQRRFPRPVSPERVASALVHAVEKHRSRVVVPGWLRAPIAVRACAPQTYARLAGRWG